MIGPSSTIPFGLPTLLTGLLVGLLGSFSDDLLGGGTGATVVQVVLWVASAALVLPSLAGLLGRGAPDPHEHGGLRNRPGRTASA